MLVDPADEGREPWLLFLLTHEIKSGDGRCCPSGCSSSASTRTAATFAGWAPHLDLEPSPEPNGRLLEGLCSQRAVDSAPIRSNEAVALAAATLVPDHYGEVAGRRIAHVDKTLAAVHERLTKEIAFWSDRWHEAQGGPRSRQGCAAQPGKRPPHRDRPRRPAGEPQEGTPVHAARRQRHARRARRSVGHSRPGLLRELRGDEAARSLLAADRRRRSCAPAAASNACAMDAVRAR